MHVTQYQKNEGPAGTDGGTSEYRLDVSLHDDIDDPMGGVSLLSAAGGVYEGIDSQLPDVFKVMVGDTDLQPVYFMYNGQAWDSGDSQCKVGAYDGGIRGIDCGFTC